MQRNQVYKNDNGAVFEYVSSNGISMAFEAVIGSKFKRFGSLNDAIKHLEV